MVDEALAVILAVGFVAVGLSVIPFDRWLDERRERRDARRRNQAHPWKETR